jgi:hypothetical protein
MRKVGLEPPTHLVLAALGLCALGFLVGQGAMSALSSAAAMTPAGTGELLSWLRDLDLADLGLIGELLRRVIALVAWGGVAMSMVASLLFIATWVLSHLRAPRDAAEDAPGRLLPMAALVAAAVPVALTAGAGLLRFLPGMLPMTLRLFALAVLLAAGAWTLGVGAILAGGSPKDLRRARQAILLAGTPWYCLAIYLASWL